jgi:hypothetical protein
VPLILFSLSQLIEFNDSWLYKLLRVSVLKEFWDEEEGEVNNLL